MFYVPKGLAKALYPAQDPKEFFVNVDKSNFPDNAMNFIQSDGSLQIKPEDGNIDGFYAMRWERKK